MSGVCTKYEPGTSWARARFRTHVPPKRILIPFGVCVLPPLGVDSISPKKDLYFQYQVIWGYAPRVCAGAEWSNGFEMSLPQCLGYALGMRQTQFRHQPISEITSRQTGFLFPPVGVDIHICYKEKAYLRRMMFWSTSTWEYAPKACTNAYWTRDFGICARYAPGTFSAGAKFCIHIPPERILIPFGVCVLPPLGVDFISSKEKFLFPVSSNMGICAKGMRQRRMAQWLRHEPSTMFGVCAGYAPGTSWAPTTFWIDPPLREILPHRGSRLQSSSGKGSWVRLGTIFLSQE